MPKPKELRKKVMMYWHDELAEAVAQAARRRYMTKADYIRSTIVERLEREGELKQRDKAA